MTSPSSASRIQRIAAALLLLLAVLCPSAAGGMPAPPPPTVSGQPTELSFFGVNGYFTGYERNSIPNEVQTLLPMGTAAGMRWTREEIVWANIQNDGAGDWHFSHYDSRLTAIAEAGYGIVGILISTPTWAKKTSCNTTPLYFCPPQDPATFATFATTVVERYDGDGIGDAAGHPRVAYWEIWNEPNHPDTWHGGNLADRAHDYAHLLQAAYPAIKAANPTAQVLFGGVYIYAGNNSPWYAYDGIPFINSVWGAHAEALYHFDILSIHPYMPDAAPDKPGLNEDITMLGRLQTALTWVAGHRPGVPVWVTEVGWSTCTAGQGDCDSSLAKTEDQQANYLLRTHVFALSKGIAHLSTFQLEDKFDGSSSKVWGGCAVLKTAAQGYAAKKAYNAYGVMVGQLDDTTYLSTGPRHTSSRSDYRFQTPDNGYVDVLWRPDEKDETLSFPVANSSWTITWIERDGLEHPLTPSGGYVSFHVSGKPGYLRQCPLPKLAPLPGRIGFLTLSGVDPSPRTLSILNAGAGTFTWTLTVVSGTQWFSATPASGNPPADVIVRADAPTSTGVYSGALEVDAGTAGHDRVDLIMWVVDEIWSVYLPLLLRHWP